jgi:ferric-dicitrate binding protein FerR (iron transport regulator)
LKFPLVWHVSRRDFLGLGVGTAGALLCNASDAAESAGQVELVRNEALALGEGQARRLSIRDPIFLGELLKTGADARLGLLLGRRTTLKLGELSEIRIDRYIADAGGGIEILNGAVLFERTGKPAASGLRFQSAYGLIAVRGTRFMAGPSKSAFGVFCDRGKVEVTAAGKSVVLGPGQGTDLLFPGFGPTDPSKWGEGRVKELRAAFK